MGENKIERISDALFHWLTIECVKKQNDIGLFTNKVDNNIYVILDRNDEPYFIINGKVALLANGKIDHLKTDSFLIVRNPNTKIVKSINRNEICNLIDYTSLEKYTRELENAFFEVCENIKVEKEQQLYKNFTEAINEFEKYIIWATDYISNFNMKTDEDIFDYADRIGNKESINKIRKAKTILNVKQYIDKLWSLVLYKKDMESLVKKLIHKRVIGLIKYCSRNNINERYFFSKTY